MKTSNRDGMLEAFRKVGDLRTEGLNGFHCVCGFYSFIAAAAMFIVLQLLPATTWAQANQAPKPGPNTDGKTISQEVLVSQKERSTADHASSDGRVAFVSAPKALIYSGPAEEFYPTHLLPHGTAVRVYHQTESGWVAIRPPKGSFSWIPASEVFLLPGGKTAEVTTNNSVSWIGTSLGTANQYRWQVRLHKAEQLVVLGEEVVKDSEGREALWYKISPPNGEFRWIQSGSIVSEPPAAIAMQHGDPKEEVEESETCEEAEVQLAGYEGIIVHESDSEVVWDGDENGDGDIIDGGIYYDDSTFEGGYYIEPEVIQEPDASWNDWQLFEFTDEGLRFPLWERALAKRANVHDPLLHDPFSLSMAPKVKGPRLRSVLQEEPALPARHRRTPWRDPRMLAQQRTQGYPQASTHRGSGTTLSALRGAWNSSEDDRTDEQPFSSDRSSWERNSMQSIIQTPSLDYYRDRNQPRPAPSLNQSTGIPGVSSGMDGSGNWLSRNWFGLQQQFSNTGANIAEAGSTALMQLQLKLNEIVTQPMVQWNFGHLKSQVQQMIHGGQSPVERGQARLLLERIEAFEQLAVRSGYHLASYSDVPSGLLASSNVNAIGIPPQLPPLVSTASYIAPVDDFSHRRPETGSSFSGVSDQRLPDAGVAGNRVNPTQFEATGWMVPVYATTAGQPSHAITDDNGRIVAYVTGLPGMNLDRYVNQAVGINGLRGYLPQLQAAHIEAQNVVRIR